MDSLQIETIKAYNTSAEKYQKTIAELDNYNETFDYLEEKLNDNNEILDLACGPANISSYLLKRKSLNVTGYDLSDKMLDIAKTKVPRGTFFKQSIIDFNAPQKFDAVINGFGLPYLNPIQAIQSLQNSVNVLNNKGFLYISFMEGEESKLERPSFNHDVEFLIFYHRLKVIEEILKDLKLTIIKKWKIDYLEEDGSITIDNIIIAQKL